MSLPSIAHHPSPSPNHTVLQPGVFGHLASPTNLISPGTSQRQSRRHLTNAWVAETRGCPRERGRWVSGCGQGAPEDAQGPGRQLARRAGGRHLSVWAPLPPAGNRLVARSALAVARRISRGCALGPSRLQEWPPTSQPTAPQIMPTPQGCRRVRLVPGSEAGGGRIGMGGRVSGQRRTRESDAGPMEISAWGKGLGGARGTRPQFQAEGEGTCSRDWKGKAGLWADMGEGALGAEIEGKHGRRTGAGEGSSRHGWGPERLRAESRRGPESRGQTRRGDGGGGQSSCRLERGFKSRPGAHCWDLGRDRARLATAVWQSGSEF